jgi:hypothetical protein
MMNLSQPLILPKRLSLFLALRQLLQLRRRLLLTSIKPVNWFNVRVGRSESRLLLDV